MTKYGTLVAANKAKDRIKARIDKNKKSLVADEIRLKEISEQIAILEDRELVVVLRKYDIGLPDLLKIINGGKLDKIQLEEDLREDE